MASVPTENKLTSFSIPFKACSIPFVPEYTNLRTTAGEFYPGESPPSHVFLCRDGSTLYTGVLECYLACPARLNPPGFEYGPIPKLADFSQDTADSVFGKPQAEAEFNTYKMHDKAGNTFLLDLTFLDNRLTRYRVRTKHFRIAPDWNSIDEKTDAKKG